MYYDLDDNNTSTVAPSPTTPAGPPSTSTGTSTSGSPPVVSTTVAPTIPTPVNPNPMAYSLNDSNSTNVVCLSLTTAFKVVITEVRLGGVAGNVKSCVHCFCWSVRLEILIK